MILSKKQTTLLVLGALALTSVNGATFTLNVTFTLPGDASLKPATYNATRPDTISAGTSGASVVWSTTTLAFNSATSGPFLLTLEPSTPINAPSRPDASRIRRTITSALPEQLTLLILGSDLAGLAALAKRRKKISSDRPGNCFLVTR